MVKLGQRLMVYQVPQGVFGGASFEYQYGGVGPLNPDIDSGLVRFLDTDTQNSATQIQFSELDSNGDSVFSFIEMLSSDAINY